MRLFLAIPLPDAQRAVLARLQGDLRCGRLVNPDLFHLTLVFLGDNVLHDTAEELHMALDSMRLPSVEITLQGLGHFGHDSPRALWIGASPGEILGALVARLSNAARRVGCDVPRRRFVPHVTLARFAGTPGEAAAVAGFLSRHGGMRLDPFRPHAVELVRSHLGRSGPDHELLASYPLA